MKKLFKLLVTSVLAASVMASFVGCNNETTTDPGEGGGEIFGITTRPENDFENDPNRHDRKPVERTLTLKGGATFADGSTSKVLLSGETLEVGTDIKVNIPDGKIISGWLADDSDDATLYGEFYTGANFETLRKNATIQPVFDVPSETYAPIDVAEKPEFGKVSNFAWEQRLDDPQTSQNGYIWKDNLTKVPVNNEMGSYFHVSGGTIETSDPEQLVPGGWHTLFLSEYEVVSEQAYGVTYTLQNLGDEDIDVRVYQTNSSSSPMPVNTASAPVHLEPNEVGQLFVSFSGWKNGNILTSLELINPVKELKVGMYAYVSDHSEPQSHKLTVTDSKIVSESDVATADIPAGKLVELEYTGTPGSDKIFCGWQDTSDTSQKYPSKFVMPNKALTLEPWLENKEDHKHTITLVGEGISFGGEVTTKEMYWNDVLDLSDIQYSGELKPGHKIIYTVEGGGIKSQLTNSDAYTMPDSDVTIKLVGTEVVWSSSNGKVAMAPFAQDLPNPSNTHRIRRDKSQMAPTGGELSIVSAMYDKSTLDISASIVDIDGEEAAYYDLRGYDQGSTDDPENPERFLDTIAPDAVFMQQVNHNVVMGEYTDTVTIKNFGEKAITIQIHISLSSGDFDRDGSSEVITIQPGETKTVTYNIKLPNDNNSEMISIQYKGAEAIESMQIGMYIYRQPKK